MLCGKWILPLCSCIGLVSGRRQDFPLNYKTLFQDRKILLGRATLAAVNIYRCLGHSLLFAQGCSKLQLLRWPPSSLVTSTAAFSLAFDYLCNYAHYKGFFFYVSSVNSRTDIYPRRIHLVHLFVFSMHSRIILLCISSHHHDSCDALCS